MKMRFKAIDFLQKALNEIQKQKEIDKDTLLKIQNLTQQIDMLVMEHYGIYDDFVDNYDYDDFGD